MEQLSKPIVQKLLNRLDSITDYAKVEYMLEGLSEEEVQVLKAACHVMEENWRKLL